MFHKKNFEIRFFLSTLPNNIGEDENIGEGEDDMVVFVKSPFQSSLFWTFCYSLDPISAFDYQNRPLEGDLHMPIPPILSEVFPSRSLFEIYKENFSLHTMLDLQQSYQNRNEALLCREADHTKTLLHSDLKSREEQKEQEEQKNQNQNIQRPLENTGLLHMSNQMELDLKCDNEIPRNISRLRSYLFSV